MSDLPPLVLALQPVPGSPRTLVAVRDGSAPVRAGFERWPLPPPPGALFLHWPARFVWTEASFRCRGEVRRTAGADFPLATVLGRLGLAAPRGLPALTALLAEGLGDIEDPEALGERLVEGLAARLAEAGAGPAGAEAANPGMVRDGKTAVGSGERTAPGLPPAAPSGTRPRPELADALYALPDAPGVYAFADAEGRVLYVGKARSLRSRVPRHFGPRPAEPEKSRHLAERAVKLTWTVLGSELEALLREQLRLRRESPPLNTQERVHVRPRGTWRRAAALLVLPSAEAGWVEVCLVAGDGRFHWERAPRRARVPRTLARRLAEFLGGGGDGRLPGASDLPLTAAEASEMAELTLSWLVRHGDAVTRIDLRRETPGRHLLRRVRRLLGEDPARGRTEAR